MVLDFSFYLVVALIVCGVVWALDAWWLRRRRLARHGEEAREPAVVDYARSFFPIILIVLVVRSFAFEPFRIPSGSMMPTLYSGDFIFVNKYVYGLTLPVLNTQVVQFSKPGRGDVIVFRLPSDHSTNFIKRVVGLPGDTVTYSNRQLVINGDVMPVRQEGAWEEGGAGVLQLGKELLGAQEHEVLWRLGGGSRQGTYEVPEGHYFVMGDNRDNSTDSRYPEVGLIPEELLIGKAVYVWLNWDVGAGPDWSRMGRVIR